MKRLLAATVLFGFVVSAYLIGFFNIKSVYKRANELLEECVIAFEEKEDLNKKTEELEEYWSKSEKSLSFFSNHSHIDEIELAIHLLKVHSQRQDPNLFYEYSGKVKMLLHQLKEDNVPSVHSIF